MITLDELKEQIENIEGVKLSIKPHNISDVNKRIYRNYPHTIPINGDKTVDDLLYERVYPILNNTLRRYK